MTEEPVYVELNVTGDCWACGEPLRDHTVAELDLCADTPLGIVFLTDGGRS